MCACAFAPGPCGTMVNSEVEEEEEEAREADGAGTGPVGTGPGPGGGSMGELELASAKKRSAWKRAERVRPLSRKDRMRVE